MRTAYTLFAFLFATALAAAQDKRACEHVVIVSIDGLRPDAIEKAPAPTLQALIKAGASAAKAQTITPSITLPSHTSMLTGLDYDRHGVTHNDYRAGSIEHETILTLAKKADRTTAMFFAKDKFWYIARDADFVYGEKPGGPNLDDSAAGIAKAFAQTWSDKKFSLTFVHLKEPDSAGHAKGWMGTEYLAAVKESDRAVATIVETLKKSGRWEKTALIVTSDHGGSGKSHGENTPENTTIPWICVAPRVKAGLTIARPIHTFDTAPTALALLGIAPPNGMDGKVVAEVVR